MFEKTAVQVTKDFMRYVQGSPTSAHAVEQAILRLRDAGFGELREGEAWTLKPRSKAYVKRGAGSLLAFRLGDRPLQKTGARIVGAHTDSPGLRLKPHACYRKEGYFMLGVEVYGGPLLASWTDRDLSLAGRVVVAKDDAQEVILVDLKRPICRISQLAVHLNRKVNDKGLVLDRQKHLPPVFGLESNKVDKGELELLVAEAAGVPEDRILNYSLALYDTQPPAFLGVGEKMYAASRIDNLAGCFGALEALLATPEDAAATSMIALFDNEEIGSRTYIGAGSSLMETVLERLCLQGKNPREDLLRALAQSLLVSSDGGHAVHPNYSDMHDKHHKPVLNGGPVIKVHAGKKFATTAETRAHFIRCANRAGVPYQLYVNRTDLTSGSTIGPIASTRSGLSTVDVGVPMLSMHSVRELGGVEDLKATILAQIQHFVG